MDDKDFYDSYDDKKGNGVLIVGAAILGVIFLILSIWALINGEPFMFIIVCIYITAIIIYIYTKKKDNKSSYDNIPTNKTKEQIIEEYVARRQYKEYKEKELEELKKYAINIQAQEALNKPKCPICQSTNLSKISTTKKVAKIAAFGVFGMGDNGKTWKCNNCGSKF